MAGRVQLRLLPRQPVDAFAIPLSFPYSNTSMRKTILSDSNHPLQRLSELGERGTEKQHLQVSCDTLGAASNPAAELCITSRVRINLL